MKPAPVLAEAFEPHFVSTCEAALHSLMQDVPEVFSAMVSTEDGFELSASSRNRTASSRLAALSSSLLAVSKAAMRELRLSGTGSLLIENDAGKVLIVEARTQPHSTVLCVAADHQAMTGKLLWAAKRCVQLMSA